MRIADGRITDLALLAEADEMLKWRASEMGRPRGPEVAQLPAGRPINISGRVRYGLVGVSVG